MKLLLCEDEKELSNALKAILRHNNYTVDAVYDGKDALAYAEADQYDGIILDLMMPKMNGLEVLSTLRSHGNNTPVLILTAKSETEDKITGLDLGADDYLAKPFDMGELLARVRAVTRRSTGNAIDTITYGDLTLNKQSFELSTSKETIRLGGKEYGIIELLISNPASLISTEKIMERVWGYDSEADKPIASNERFIIVVAVSSSGQNSCSLSVVILALQVIEVPLKRSSCNFR